MATTVPFVIERRLQYHGIWNAGYNIGELFLKNIGREFVTKQPFPAVLKLSIGSLVLAVYQRTTNSQPPREIRTDTIPFGALRDVTVNAFNSRCLMVIYVNNKKKFSVLVTSCRDAKEAADISVAFKKLSGIARAKKQQAEQNAMNWIMRESDSSDSTPTITTSPTATNNINNNNNNSNHISSKEQTSTKSITDERDNLRKAENDIKDNNEVNGKNSVTLRGGTSRGAFDETDGTNGRHTSTATSVSDTTSIKSRTESSVLNENFDFLKDHDEASLAEDDSIFLDGDEAIICDREEGPGQNCSSVGLQVDLEDRSDLISVSSEASSSLSFHWIRDEVDHVTPNSAIAEEEYSRRMLEATVDGSVQNGDKGENGHAAESSLVNGYKEDENWHVVKVDESEKYDLRGIGIQTEGSLTRTRYTKRSTHMKSSNMYKAMAEQRKLKQNAEDSPRPLGLQTVTLPKVSAGARPHSYHGSKDVRGMGSHQSPHMPRTTVRGSPSGSTNTVNRPIEQVYQRSSTWSRRTTGEPRKRRILVVHSGRNSLRI